MISHLFYISQLDTCSWPDVSRHQGRRLPKEELDDILWWDERSITSICTTWFGEVVYYQSIHQCNCFRKKTLYAAMYRIHHDAKCWFGILVLNKSYIPWNKFFWKWIYYNKEMLWISKMFEIQIFDDVDCGE